MIFSRGHAWSIAEGRKTLAFSASEPKHKTIGKTYAVQIRAANPDKRPEGPIAYIQLLEIDQVRLGDIDDAEAQRAGYQNAASFKHRWWESGYKWESDRMIWRSEFRLVNPNARAA